MRRTSINALLLLSLALFTGCFVGGGGQRCDDGLRNGNESDVDCGGSCGPCAPGARCFSGNDCLSGACISGICSALASCNDGVQNGNETGVDCGGSCQACLYVGGPLPPGNTPIYRIAPGFGTVVQPGVEPGYGITANVGRSYRIVWTGQGGGYNRFYGSVWTQGQFTAVVPGCNGQSCPLEQQDFISQVTPVAGGQRLDFDALASSGIDGFDFVISSDPAWFDVFIDGQRYPTLIFFPATDNGGAVSNVATIPFGLTVQ